MGRTSTARQSSFDQMMPGPHINQLPAAGADAPHPAVFSRFGVLHVPSNTSPRLLEERHLAALATNPGEIGGLENLCASLTNSVRHTSSTTAFWASRMVCVCPEPSPIQYDHS
jgi:hypothetical protein